MLPTGGWKRGISAGRNLAFCSSGTAGPTREAISRVARHGAAISIHAAPQ